MGEYINPNYKKEYAKKYWAKNKDKLKENKQLWDSTASNHKNKERKIIFDMMPEKEQINNMLEFTKEIMNEKSSDKIDR